MLVEYLYTPCTNIIMSLFNSNYFADTGPKAKRKTSKQLQHDREHRRWNERMKKATTLTQLENIFGEKPLQIRRKSIVYRREKDRLLEEEAKRRAAAENAQAEAKAEAKAEATAEATARATDGFQLPIDDVDVFLEKERAYFNQPIDLNALKEAVINLVCIAPENADRREFLQEHLPTERLQSMLMSYSFRFRLGIVASKHAYRDMCHRSGTACDDKGIDAFIEECLALPLEAKWGVKSPRYRDLESHPLVRKAQEIFESIHTVSLSHVQHACEDTIRGIEERHQMEESKRRARVEENEKRVRSYAKHVQAFEQRSDMFATTAGRFDSTGPRVQTIYTDEDECSGMRSLMRIAFIIAKMFGSRTNTLETLAPEDGPDGARLHNVNLAAVSTLHASDMHPGTFGPEAVAKHAAFWRTVEGDLNYTAGEEMGNVGAQSSTIGQIFVRYANYIKERGPNFMEEMAQVNRGGRNYRPSETTRNGYRDMLNVINGVAAITGGAVISRVALFVGLISTIASLQNTGFNIVIKFITPLLGCFIHYTGALDETLLVPLLEHVEPGEMFNILFYRQLNLDYQHVWGFIRNAMSMSGWGGTVVDGLRTIAYGIEIQQIDRVIKHFCTRPRGIATVVDGTKNLFGQITPENITSIIQCYHEGAEWHMSKIFTHTGTPTTPDDTGQPVYENSFLNTDIKAVKKLLASKYQITFPIAEIVSHDGRNHIVIDRYMESGKYGILTNVSATAANKMALLDRQNQLSSKDISWVDEMKNMGAWSTFGASAALTGLAVAAGYIAPMAVPAGYAASALGAAGVQAAVSGLVGLGLKNWFNASTEVPTSSDMGDLHAFVLLFESSNRRIVWDVVTGEIIDSEVIQAEYAAEQERKQQYYDDIADPTITARIDEINNILNSREMRLSQRTSSNVAEYRKTLMDELRNLQAQLAKHPLDGWNFTTDTFWYDGARYQRVNGELSVSIYLRS